MSATDEEYVRSASLVGGMLSKPGIKENAFDRLGEFFTVLIVSFRDRSLFIARGGEYFRGDHSIFGRKKGGSVVTENPRRGIAKNFGRIQRGDHSNLLGK